MVGVRVVSSVTTVVLNTLTRAFLILETFRFFKDEDDYEYEI